MRSPDNMAKVTGETVREDFNNINTVLHYTRAAHDLGLWASERALIERHFPGRDNRLLEAGCGAGRVAVGLWQLGYRNIVAFDFASELVEQAENLAAERGISGLAFLQADATSWSNSQPSTLNTQPGFDGALFMFNGLMQIPGRSNRRAAMRELHRACRPGATFLFTTHDREDPQELQAWAREAELWARGEQNPRLVEFGDRYFAHDHGATFMHLPDRKEVMEDLVATGWRFEHSALRDDLATESVAVREFSDNCRFWVAKKP
jgi:SAM-dependent methyltransferase